MANLLTCRERVQVNSQDSGSAEVVGSTGMRMVMVIRMSIPLTSRSSFLWSDTIDNVKAKSRTKKHQFIFAENQLEDERTSSIYNNRVLNLHNRGLMLMWLVYLCKGARPQSKKG